MFKRVYSIPIIIILVLLVLNSCDLFSPLSKTSVTISGKVLFANSTSHDGIIVSLESKDGYLTKNVSSVINGESKSFSIKALDYQTTTDINGNYIFSNIPEGE